MQRVTALRYVVPLREGGSLPAIVDADRGQQYVVKFRGAGQGPKALIAEVLAASLASALDLPVPQPAVVTLAEGFGLGEPDPEIQDILRGSAGANFGLAYLPGALGFDGAADGDRVEPDLAAAIVWFDAFITNVDRTPRNPNLLLWRERLWMIDHGASLYFHHRAQDWMPRAQDPFPLIKEHILLHRASAIGDADERLRPLLTEAVIWEAVDDVPEDWLEDERQRGDYTAYFLARLNGPRTWVQEAERAREQR